MFQKKNILFLQLTCHFETGFLRSKNKLLIELYYRENKKRDIGQSTCIQLIWEVPLLWEQEKWRSIWRSRILRLFPFLIFVPQHFIHIYFIAFAPLHWKYFYRTISITDCKFLVEKTWVLYIPYM